MCTLHHPEHRSIHTQKASTNQLKSKGNPIIINFYYEMFINVSLDINELLI